MKFENLLFAVASGAALVLSGCSGSADHTSATAEAPSNTALAALTTTDAAHTVLAVPTSLQIAAGSSAQLQAQVNDTSGQPVGGASIVFRSTDPAMIAVTQQGVVSALGPIGVSAVTIASGVRVVEVPVRVLPGPGAVLDVVQGPSGTIEAGAPIGDITVRVRDQFENPVPRAPLRWHVDVHNGVVTSSTDVTAADGTGSAHWIADQKAGPQTLSIQSGDLPPLVLLANVQPGAPTALQILADPSLKDGDAVETGQSIRIQAKVIDRNGNGVGGLTVALETTGACHHAQQRLVTETTGLTSVVTWSATGTGRCVWVAAIDRPAIETRLAVTIVPAVAKP